uniref:At2g23090-like zinc-binding domain-containing protein n=1 Tax=Globisporangium ultimum (strain ATCC 200006 / CBS 805.95 / DAOM BR144) TaxID=431595 RepID=K3WAH5_GLOUD
MGGGNGQKSATARERNAAKKMKEAKLKQREANKGKITADREGLKCKICMTTFMITANIKLLEEHFNSKHNQKGMTITQCFPHLAASS